MSTEVKITQTKSVVDVDPPNEVYKFRLVSVVTIIDSDTGFDEPEVFLMDTANNEFQHTCTLGDYFNYPDTDPGTPPPDYYREDSVTLNFDDLDAAIAEAALQITRLQNLITDWENHADSNWGTISTPVVDETDITGD